MVVRWAGGRGGVDGEPAEVFAGGGVDDADVQVPDEQQDVASVVGSVVPMWWRRPARRRVRPASGSGPDA